MESYDFFFVSFFQHFAKFPRGPWHVEILVGQDKRAYLVDTLQIYVFVIMLLMQLLRFIFSLVIIPPEENKQSPSTAAIIQCV